MNTPHQPRQPQDLDLSQREIYSALFRHKWYIFFIFVITSFCGAYFFVTTPPSYESQAKLLIGSLPVANSSESVSGGEPSLKSRNREGNRSINSAMLLLKSMDIATQVATEIGPERLLPSAEGGTNLFQAAALIHENLAVEALNNSDVISVTFQHQDPKIAQTVLNRLIKAFTEAWDKAYTTTNFYDELEKGAETLEASIEKTESALSIMTTTNAASLSTNDIYPREADIARLQRKKDLQVAALTYAQKQIDQSKVDWEMLQKNVRITLIQDASPPIALSSVRRVIAALVVLGYCFAFGLPFIREFVIYSSVVRNSKEIEGDLGMRLFLSIPKMKRKNPGREALKAPKDTAAPELSSGKFDVTPWDPNNFLYEYYEALRDRLISYFDVNNLTHKPKLVAVTGASKGSGATSIAVGLAASMSQTGEGKVLLIDMNYANGGAQSFYHGKPECELDAALTDSTRETAMVQDNLYVVSSLANGDKLARMLPKKFATLVPKFEASKYDYIIFDMPPISRTGVTQRLAGFMDMMLVVVEAEKTSRDVVRQANSLLMESKAKVSVILNKTRNYVPERLLPPEF